MKEKMLKENLKIENEKSMIKRKISNFRNTLCNAPCNNITSIKDQTQIPTTKNSEQNPDSDLEISRVSNLQERSKISPKKEYGTAEYYSKNFDAQSMENDLNISKNPDVSKKYLLETDDEQDDRNMSNNQNVVNEILSDVEQNCLKYYLLI